MKFLEALTIVGIMSTTLLQSAHAGSLSADNEIYSITEDKRTTSDHFIWSLEPKLKNPACDRALEVAVKVKQMPKDLTLVNEHCVHVTNFLGGIKAKREVDLMLLCGSRQPDVYKGDRTGKIVFTYQPPDPTSAIDFQKKGHQHVKGKIRVSDETYGYITDVEIEMLVDVVRHKEGFEVKYLQMLCF